MKKAFLFIRAGALVAAVCMVIIAVTFSWFNFEISSSVDELEGSVIGIDGNGSQITYVSNAAGWFDEITFPTTATSVFKPISGNGDSFFKRAYKAQEVSGSFYGSMVADGYEQFEPVPALDYVVLEYKIKNAYAADMYLDASSYVLPSSLDEDSLLENSEDLAAGAIRLCVSQRVGESYEKKLVWIPNATYELADESRLDGAVEDTYVFRYGNAEDEVLTLSTADSESGNPLSAGKQLIDGVWYLWGDLEDIPDLPEAVIASFGADTEEQFRLTVWLEGTDRECTDAVIGGNIKALVKFNTVRR